MFSFDSGIIFGLLGLFGYGLANVWSQQPSQKLGSLQAILYRDLVIIPIILFGLFFYPWTNFSLQGIGMAILAAIIGYIGLATFFQALKIGKIGLVVPVAQSSVIITILLSIIFFQEPVSAIKWFSIGLIFVGIILGSLNFGDLKNSNILKVSSGVPLALMACVAWGIAFFLFKFPVQIIGPVGTSVLVELANVVLSLFGIVLLGQTFEKPDTKTTKYLIFGGIAVAAAVLGFNIGIKSFNVTLIAALTFANPVVSLAYSQIFLKERLSLQQYLGAFNILSGIVLISLN